MSGSLLNTVKFLACILIMLIECGLVIYGWLASIIRSTWPVILLGGVAIMLGTLYRYVSVDPLWLLVLLNMVGIGYRYVFVDPVWKKISLFQ